MIWWALVALAVVVFIVAGVLLWVADSSREKANETYNSMSKTVRNIVEHDRFEARGDSDTLRRNLRQDIRKAVKEVMTEPKFEITDDDYLKIPLVDIFDVTINHPPYYKPDTTVTFLTTREDQGALYSRLEKLAEARKLNSQKDADEVAKKLKKKGKRA
jgi:hypothetical protein